MKKPKVLLFSGSHARHLFVHKAILESGFDCAVVLMEREDVIPDPPTGIKRTDQDNFVRHFRDRSIIEDNVFGRLDVDSVFNGIPCIRTTSETLNSPDTISFVKSFGPDIVFIFGTDLIFGDLLDALPYHKLNMHLGLSPWYKGSATLFWPFYFLQPQYAGATFHRIVPAADAGGVLHQSVPNLAPSDGIHDVAVKTVIKARDDLVELLEMYVKNGWEYQAQNSSGRLFLTKDFEPHHLRVIYNLFDNNIVEAYLNGELGSRKPNLISAF